MLGRTLEPLHISNLFSFERHSYMYVRRNQLLCLDLNLKPSYFSISKTQNKNSKSSVNDHRKFNTSNKSQIGFISTYSSD